MGRLWLMIALLVTTLLTNGQKGGNPFASQWKQVDTLVLGQDLSRSALKLVNDIYEQAKARGLQVQMIKALLYRYGLEQRFTETDINQKVQALEQEIAATSDAPAKAILSSLLAGTYLQYWQQNRWQLYNRSKTVNYIKTDIATWNATDLHAAISYWYQQSLHNDGPLKQTDIGNYNAILTQYNTKAQRPTLYDLLAHRALAYYKTEDNSVTKPLNAFVLNSAAALGNIDTFMRHVFETNDSLNNKWRAMQLFKQLTCFHFAQHDTAALIDVDLERIAFARSNGSITGADSLYYAAVKATAQRFNANRHAAQAWYLLAAWHAQKAGQYQPLTDSTHQWQYLAALQIANRFLPLTDSTQGHINLYNLYHSITAKQLSVTMERVNVPALPFKALVQYKNVPTVYYRIIRLTPTLEDSLDKKMQKAGYDALIQLATTLTFNVANEVAIPQLNDYQQHSVEIKLDPLPTGKYYLLTSSAASFSDTARLTLSTFYISNISYVNNGPDYFVLNRTTGKPLVAAAVQVYERGYSNRTRTYAPQPKERYTTNSNGYFKLAVKKDDNRSVTLQIKYAGDELFIDNDQYITPLTYSRNNYDDDVEDYEKDEADDYEENHSKAYFFKDRSIYRPGQVVYFKLLALTKDYKTQQTKLFTNVNTSDSEYVYLQDANNQTIDSVLISLNQYGSFAGSFKLPANTLTGEFSLSADFFDEEINTDFLVEEYKRPTFYVALDKPTGAYRLNDTLTVTATTKAYAGSTVDGATIQYRVTRKGRFMYPWLWYRGIRPSAAETTITFGEATTDAEGKFPITFAALPDETIGRESLPVFDFEVHADITDRAGETRSETITAAAAYHSLNIKLNIAATAEADSLKTFTVATENIAGDKEPAEVKVMIYPLQSPKKLLRSRYWQRPDVFIYTRGEHDQLFANDEYANESDKATWPKGEAVFSTTINTKTTNKGTIPPKTLTAGWYLVEAIATDKDGNKIKSQQYTQLYSKSEGRFSGNNYLFTSIINNATEPGQPAAFLLGSNASDVHVIQQTQHQPKQKSTTIQSDFAFFTLNKNVKEISVVPGVSDVGGMGVHIVFAKDNRMYTFTQQIMVNNPQQQLDVVVKTYRNKIEPGSKETWTIQLFGNNKEAAAAEVLTSMYDASLDQFTPHAWQIPFEPTPTFYANGWDNNNGFESEAGRQNQPNVPAKSYYMQYADIDNQMGLPPAPRQMEMMLQGRAAGIDVGGNLNDVVVTGYGVTSKTSMTSSVITIRGGATISGTNAPLYVVDGIVVTSIEGLNPDDFASVEVLKDAAATALYGAKNGVVIISTKKAAGKKEEAPLKVRTNFNETAFFYPQLLTDKQGNLSFSFTLPDALTQWKWQVFAHNKTPLFGLTQKTIVSQKTLMIQANAPRFMQQGDTMQFSAKISNLSEQPLNGTATLELIDAITLQPIDQPFMNKVAGVNFSVPANQSTSVAFSLSVPANFTNPVTWRVIARAGAFSDGEENTLPVLSNRMLVTESLPLFVKGDTTKNFTFTKLLQQQSTTLQRQSVTVEYTTNPVWYAVQSLPYLVKYPYECAEQTFNRFFANALAAYIINSNPTIKKVFDVWQKDTTALKSNLAKNEALKSILLQETPWVMEAESEEQQKRNIALLFNEDALEEAYETAIEKLQQLQMASGAFAWFKGGYEDRYITQYIVAGIGRLQMLKAVPETQRNNLQTIANKALQYLDEAIAKDYDDLLKYKADLSNNNIGNSQLQYLYTRSYFGNNVSKASKTAYDYYYQQAKKYWIERNFYFRAMTGQILLRNDEGAFVLKNIVPALLENAVTGYETGTYWKQNERGYYWHQAPIEQQALMIEFFNDMKALDATLLPQVDEMKTWLLRQKQTNHWATTKATADACYALLLGGSDWLSAAKKVTINIGNVSINGNGQQQEAGSGYFKTTIPAKQVTAAMGNIQVTTTSAGKNSNNKIPSWGAVYWQYFEDLDKITTAATPLAITKKLFVESNTSGGVVLTPVNNGDQLKVGDKVKIQVVIKVDRDMEYVHLKDMRAAAMEPVNVLSGYRYQDGLGYYESTRDAATNFFIANLPKGTYVFEYPVTITHSGNYSVGIATAQCMYAPEFTSHSEGIRVQVINR